MDSIRARSSINRFLFPAPPPSYRWSDFPSKLVWIPTVSSDSDDDPDEKDDTKLAALFIQNPRCASHLMIYFHGNGEDLGLIYDHLVDYARRFRVHILAPEYPGYGPNTALDIHASEQSVNVAARSALSFAVRSIGIPPPRIILFGRSIGTGPASQLAASLSTSIPPDPPSALILQSPYLSIKSLARSLVGKIAGAMLDRFDSATAMRSISHECPIMFVHGARDDLIPKEHSERLLEISREVEQERGDDALSQREPSSNRDIFVSPTADHNVWRHNEDVVDPILAFLARHVPESVPGGGPALIQPIEVSEWSEPPAKVMTLATESGDSYTFFDSVVGGLAAAVEVSVGAFSGDSSTRHDAETVANAKGKN